MAVSDEFAQSMRTGTKYCGLARTLAVRIRDGVYGERLPSHRDLAEEFGVTHVPMAQAFELLKYRG